MIIDVLERAKKVLHLQPTHSRAAFKAAVERDVVPLEQVQQASAGGQVQRQAAGELLAYQSGGDVAEDHCLDARLKQGLALHVHDVRLQNFDVSGGPGRCCDVSEVAHGRKK